MVIKNIRHGKGQRAALVYADLYTDDGTLLISALLDYVVARIPKLLDQGE